MLVVIFVSYKEIHEWNACRQHLIDQSHGRIICIRTNENVFLVQATVKKKGIAETKQRTIV